MDQLDITLTERPAPAAALTYFGKASFRRASGEQAAPPQQAQPLAVALSLLASRDEATRAGGEKMLRFLHQTGDVPASLALGRALLYGRGV